MKDSRRKGNNGENEVCRALSVWASSGARKRLIDYTACPVSELLFRRRSTSIQPVVGHWNGKGDILHRPSVPFGYCVEVKTGYIWSMDQAFNPGWLVWEFWKQTVLQADSVKLQPMLIVKRDRMPAMSVLRERDFKAICSTVTRGKFGGLAVLETSGQGSVVLCLLSEMVKNLPYPF
jgi:hypothetical protein